MTITFSMFCTKIGNKGLKIIPDPSRAIIGYSSFIDSAGVLKEDYVYFGKASELKSFPATARSNVILFEDEKIAPDFLENNVFNIVTTSFEGTFEALVENVKSVFSTQVQLNIFNSQLLLLVQDGVSTQKLLDFGYQTFGNPMLLLDPSLCLLNNAGTDTLMDEPVIGYVLSKGYMPAQYVEEVMKDESNATEEDRVLIIWEKDFLKHRLIAGRIVRKNHLIGYLKLFEYNRPFTDSLDVDRFKLFCQYLAINMDSHFLKNYTGHPYIETFLTDIVNRKLTDKEEIDERLQTYGLETHRYKTIIVVELEEKFKNTDKLYLLKQKLQSFLNRDTVFIYNKDVVVLFDKDSHSSLFNQERIEALHSLLEANNSRAGFSMAFQEIHDLNKYYLQALACLQVASKLRLQKHIYLYEDYLIEHMFLHFGEIFDLEELIHPCVQQLLAIDAKKDNVLIATLFCFIRYKQDISAAAKHLHIHYNTLKYRITRIEELTNIDFNDEQTMFRLALSERIIQLQKQISNNILLK